MFVVKDYEIRWKRVEKKYIIIWDVFELVFKLML